MPSLSWNKFAQLPALSTNALILLVAAFIVATGNQTFFSLVFRLYSWRDGSGAMVVALAALLFLIIALMLALFAWGRAAKPVLAATVLVCALTAAFMDSYGVVINDEMIRNVLRTNVAETSDLISLRLLATLFMMGVLPTLLLASVPLQARPWRRELLARVVLMVSLAAAMAVLTYGFSASLASFAREHKSVRSYANPGYPLYSAIKYLRSQWRPTRGGPLLAWGADARIAPTDTTRDLLILVVGETARADHFGLNGYSRDTTPELDKAGVISFANVQACGTSTAFSVPCIFSSRGAGHFEPDLAGGEENLLDVLKRTGVNVLWLDNNSDSQGVAERVPFVDFRSPENNPLCDIECRDEGMLIGLQARIDKFPTGDIVIVLHQMGNHGPAYYKRYPAAFERFGPACRNRDLGQCSREEVINAYDNAIAYTDHFLGKTIELLRNNDKAFETALLYVSDHGESLGEGGVYLHGLPRAIAPKAQLHVPAALWFGRGVKRIDRESLRAGATAPISHDNIFHTVLGFLEIETAGYRQDLDLLAKATSPRLKGQP